MVCVNIGQMMYIIVTGFEKRDHLVQNKNFEFLVSENTMEFESN